MEIKLSLRPDLQTKKYQVTIRNVKKIHGEKKTVAPTVYHSHYQAPQTFMYPLVTNFSYEVYKVAVI